MCVSVCLLYVWLVMVACYRLYLPPSLPTHCHCQGQTCTICVLVSVSVARTGVPPTRECWVVRPTSTSGPLDLAQSTGVHQWWWGLTSGCDIILALVRPQGPHQHTSKLVGLLVFSSPLLRHYEIGRAVIQPAWVPGTNQVLHFRQKYKDKDNVKQLATGTP